MIEPTCVFCQRKLADGQPCYDTKDYRTVSTTTRCHKCNVNQTFDNSGKPTNYTFEVEPYILVFNLRDNQFTIRLRTDYSNPVVTMNYIPKNLTPQSTTLERIKLLITFS